MTALLTLSLCSTFTWSAPGSAPESRSAGHLRADLEAVIVGYEQLAGSIPVQAEILDLLAEARLRLGEVPDRELAAFAPEIGADVAALRDALAASPETVTSRSTSTSTSATPTGFPGAEYPSVQWSFAIDALTDFDQIPNSVERAAVSGLCDPTTSPTPNQQFALLNVEIAAAAVKDTADRLCSFIGSIAGEGANASLLCIVTDLLYMVEKSHKETAFLCDDAMSGAETRASYHRAGHLHGDLEVTESSLARLISATESDVADELEHNLGLITDLDAGVSAHDGRFTARADRVDAALASHLHAVREFGDESFRHHVEQRLSEADHGNVAMFFLPEWAGGALEVVRGIVDETVGEAAVVGLDVRQARRLFRRGDAALGAGDFVGAYELYGRAYRAAMH